MQESFLIVWFNDCVLGKSGQIANLIIAKVDSILYYSIRVCLCLRIVNIGINSQIDIRN